MTDGERALAFVHARTERRADRVEPHPAGALVLTPSLPLAYDANFLRVDRWDGTGAELLAEADRALAGAGCRHRRVAVTADRLGEEVRPALAAAWPIAHRFLVMVHRRPPDRRAPAGVDVVDPPARSLEEARAGEARLQPWGRDERVVQQLLELDRRQAGVIPTRCFGVMDGPRVASYASLYLGDGVAEIDEVGTLAAYRGRGYARATVLRCVDEARAAGAQLVFLLADDDDWPKELYATLGFDVVGVEHVFVRPSEE